LIFEVFEKKGIECIIFLIMKQKTRFKNFGNIGYRSMNGRSIGISPKKAISVDLYLRYVIVGEKSLPKKVTHITFFE